MGRLRRLSRGKRLVVALAVGGALFAVASAVQASIPDSSGVIHACYSKTTRGLFVIDTDLGQHCNPATENALNWNQTGPTGATGATGPTGATGATGATGPSGISNVVIRTQDKLAGAGTFTSNLHADCQPGEHALAGGILRGQPGDTITSGGGVTINVEQSGPLNGLALPAAGADTATAWGFAVNGDTGATAIHLTLYVLCAS